jgi:Cu(I)/Ag(I) efflux system membrane fusion protein
MKKNILVKGVLVVAICAALLGIGYKIGSLNNQASSKSSALSSAGTTNSNIDPKTGRKVLYWHDPMVPGHRFDKPGKSPFMDMQLVPVYADEGTSDGGIKIDSSLQQNLGIRYAVVRREAVADALDVVGATEFDESAAEVVQNRANGYIDKLYARIPMQRIKRGDPIASIFVPEWVAPQEEYLALKRSGQSELVAAAKQRMRVLSITDYLIAKADQTGQAQSHVTLGAPISGVISELPVRDGAAVTPGMTIAKISGLKKVWLTADVPETSSAQIRPGMPVTAFASSNGNHQYTGKIRDILPGVDPSTRTVKARIELANDDGSLIPGLLMRVRLASTEKHDRLLIPTEAIINDGRQSVVLVRNEKGGVRPAAVTIGQSFGDDTEITNGLTEGDQVVASGQFLIDSEANLKSVLPKLSSAPVSGVTPQPTKYRGTGVVESVSSEGITFSHEPIPTLGWGAMTMEFGKAKPSDFTDIKQGQRATFTFRETENGYVLDDVQPVGGKP